MQIDFFFFPSSSLFLKYCQNFKKSFKNNRWIKSDILSNKNSRMHIMIRPWWQLVYHFYKNYCSGGYSNHWNYGNIEIRHSFKEVPRCRGKNIWSEKRDKINDLSQLGIAGEQKPFNDIVKNISTPLSYLIILLQNVSISISIDNLMGIWNTISQKLNNTSSPSTPGRYYFHRRV